MLVLTRHVRQSIVIGHDVVITVLEVRGDQVRLGITAPKDVQVHREEVFAALSAAERQESLPRDAVRQEVLPRSVAAPEVANLAVQPEVANVVMEPEVANVVVDPEVANAVVEKVATAHDQGSGS